VRQYFTGKRLFETIFIALVMIWASPRPALAQIATGAIADSCNQKKQMYDDAKKECDASKNSASSSCSNMQDMGADWRACNNLLLPDVKACQDAAQKIKKAQGVCNTVQKTDSKASGGLDNCLNEMRDCPYVNRPKKSDDSGDDDDDSSDIDKANMNYACQEGLGRELQSDQDELKSKRTEMQSTQDKVAADEKAIADAQSDEQSKEADMKDQLQQINQKMSDEMFDAQKEIQDATNERDNTTNQIRQQIQQLQSDLDNLAGPARQDMLNQYASKMRQLKLQCEQELKQSIYGQTDQNGNQTQPGQGAYVVNNMGQLGQSVSAGGGTNYICSHTRSDVYAQMDANEQLNLGQMKLQSDYNAKKKQIAALLAQLQSSMTQAAQKQGMQQLKAQQTIQNLQQQMQAKSQQMMQMQQTFAQNIQRLQANLKRDQALLQQDQNDFNADTQQVAELQKAGVHPIKDGSESQLTKDRGTVEEGQAAQEIPGCSTSAPATSPVSAPPPSNKVKKGGNRST
jgi:hypothetical protein